MIDLDNENLIQADRSETVGKCELHSTIRTELFFVLFYYRLQVFTHTHTNPFLEINQP